jgi:hypothetical protein
MLAGLFRSFLGNRLIFHYFIFLDPFPGAPSQPGHDLTNGAPSDLI